MLMPEAGAESTPTLAVVVITLNEEANLGRCLESVSGLVHSGSGRRDRVDPGVSGHWPAGAARAGKGRLRLASLPGRRRMAERRGPRVWPGMTVEPPLVFLHKYVLQLGLLDGLRGFLGASLMLGLLAALLLFVTRTL